MRWQEAYDCCPRFDEAEASQTQQYADMLRQIAAQKEWLFAHLDAPQCEALGRLMTLLYDEAELEHRYYFSCGYGGIRPGKPE